jgi:HlyD family secretion protein
MNLKAPSAGMISILQHWRSEGMTPFKAGDRAWPGAGLAELPEPSSLQISARVDETERGRLALNQAVDVQFDAIPDRQLTGHVERISTIADLDFSEGWPFPRNFIMEVVLDQTDPRLKPGMTAQLTVVLDRIPNALAVPVQAVFQKSGRDVVYVWRGTQFDERAVEFGKRSGDRVLVAKGLSPGDRVALTDPSAKE